jgi:hypothetical protein
MSIDRNKVAVELTASLFDPKTPTDVRERKMAEMNIETYLTVKDHDGQFKSIDERLEKQDQNIAGLPCKSAGGCGEKDPPPSEAVSIGPFHISFSGKQNLKMAWTFIAALFAITTLGVIIYFGITRGIK